MTLAPITSEENEEGAEGSPAHCGRRAPVQLHPQGEVPKTGTVSRYPGRPSGAPLALSRLAFQHRNVQLWAIPEAADAHLPSTHSRPWRRAKASHVKTPILPFNNPLSPSVCLTAFVCQQRSEETQSPACCLSLQVET